MTDLIPAARPVPSPEDRMRDARTDREYADRIPAPRPLTTDRTNSHHRDLHQHIAGLEADLRSQTRAVRELTAERADVAAMRRELNRMYAADMDKLRAELGAAQELIAVIDDATERIDRARATYATRGQQEATTDGLGSPADRAQDGIRPAAWEQQATDAASAGLGEAWCVLSTDPTAARRLATAAVRAIIDAGLAGPGGRCRKCGTTFPRTLPADQDPLCWTCDSEEQTGPEPR